MPATAAPARGDRRRAAPTSALLRLPRKWARMFAVFVQDALAYRAVAVIWILTDTIPALVFPLLWLSAFNGRPDIRGYAPGDITAYYLILLFVTNLVQCHIQWEMLTDIREGRFSAYLIRPFPYMAMQYLGFLSWRLMRTILFLPIFLLAVYLFRHQLHLETLRFGLPFVASLVLGHFVAFFITFPLGLLALFFTEARSLFNAWYMPLTIFSGQLAPLAMLPGWLQAVGRALPYRYTIGFPTEVLLGRLSPTEVQSGLLFQGAWIAVGYLVGRVLWARGLKHFTGVGL